MLNGIILHMSETNERTLDSYNTHLQEYIDGTPHEVSSEFKLWIDKAINLLPSSSKVLEIGSAFGRDATYIESKGLSVARTDAAQSFVDYLNENGQSAKLFNVVTDDIEGSFSMIFANAVFLHLKPDELKQALAKVHGALDKGGILAFSVKRGNGSGWSDAKLGAPRFFQYWETASLLELLEDNKFNVVWSSDETEGYRDSDPIKWIHIIAEPI